ncbi:MAG: hypothetical protein WCF23_13085, partial [Candidatus Nitrosopolaris sp.]
EKGDRCFMTPALKREKHDNEQLIISKQKNFLICESCFSCASSLYPDLCDTFLSNCPNCKHSTLKSIPISFDEVTT